MNKLLMSLISITLILTLAACSQNYNNQDQTPDTSQPDISNQSTETENFDYYGDNSQLTSAATLNQLSGKEYFEALSQIEKNCIGLSATEIIDHPQTYSNGKIYRFPGEVVWVGDGNFLLQITTTRENNLIYCYSNDYVCQGDKICVYGEGAGSTTYTRTYPAGNSIEFSTIIIDVGYILKDDIINYGNTIESYMEDFVYGDYKLSSQYTTSYALEKTLAIDNQYINNRPYRVEKVALYFTRNYVSDDLTRSVGIQVQATTNSKTGQEIILSLQFPLNGTECSYSTVYRESLEIKNYDRVANSTSTTFATPNTNNEYTQYPASNNANNYDNEDYILPGSDSRYILKSELYDFTAYECSLARNELYARHGRKFSNNNIQSYFNSQYWYSPIIDPEDFQESMLNEYEQANRDLILEYEIEQGYR